MGFKRPISNFRTSGRIAGVEGAGEIPCWTGHDGAIRLGVASIVVGLHLWLVAVSPAVAEYHAATDPGVVAPVRQGPFNCKKVFYSKEALENGGGTAVIGFVVNLRGSTEGVKVVTTSGFTDIDQAALSCVSHFTYQPASLNGVPIAVTSQATLVFEVPYDPRPIGLHDCRKEAKAADSNHDIGLTIHVGVDGSVLGVDLVGSSGDQAIDQSLISCVSNWKYRPGMKVGKPITWDLTMPAVAIELGIK